MKIEKTYRATIHVGLKEGYNNNLLHSLEEVSFICQEYVNRVPSCVSIMPTQYVYTNGFEPGAVIEFIQYPRFPTPETEILNRALELAKILMKALGQFKVCVLGPEETFMVEQTDL